MTENRRLALSVALNDYFTLAPSADDYESVSLDELRDMEADGVITVWQPFEYWDLDDVCEQVESLADAVERALKMKEILLKEKITNMDSDQVFDWCQE